jgi:hypothetical protein
MFKTFLIAFALASFIAIGTSIVQSVSGQASGPQTIVTTDPVMKNTEGQVISSASEGQLAVLLTEIVNNLGHAQSYTVIMEARDDQGLTQFLGFSIGNIEDGGRNEVGISWTPEKADNYQLRTFLITGFAEPAILSVVETGEAAIE